MTLGDKNCREGIEAIRKARVAEERHGPGVIKSGESLLCRPNQGSVKWTSFVQFVSFVLERGGEVALDYPQTTGIIVREYERYELHERRGYHFSFSLGPRHARRNNLVDAHPSPRLRYGGTTGPGWLPSCGFHEG